MNNYNPSGYYSNGYQPSYQNQYQNQGTDDRIWVPNENAAESYLIAPNGFVRLWDANKPCFYEKRADASGRPLPIEIYEYKKREIAPMGNTFEDRFNELEKRIVALEGVKNEPAESNADD